MRTTVNIHDGLLETAKRRAQESGKTLGDLLEEALQEHLTRPGPAPAGPVELPVFDGHLGVRPGVDLTTNAGLYDAMYAEEDAESMRLARGERS